MASGCRDVSTSWSKLQLVLFFQVLGKSDLGCLVWFFHVSGQRQREVKLGSFRSPGCSNTLSGRRRESELWWLNCVPVPRKFTDSFSRASRLQIFSFLSVGHRLAPPQSGDLTELHLRSKSQNASPAHLLLRQSARNLQLVPVCSSPASSSASTSGSASSSEPLWLLPAVQLLLRPEPAAAQLGRGAQRCYSADQLYWGGVSFLTRGGACLEAVLIWSRFQLFINNLWV